jgi:hypothetical protein
MDIELLEYFRRFADGEFNLLHAGALYLTGLAAVWLAGRLVPSRERLEQPGALVLAALAPIIGLALTSTIYTCGSCDGPPQCDLVTVGVPVPQQVRERVPGPGFGACWWSLTPASDVAFAANFLLGTLGLPVLVSFFRPLRAGPPTGEGIPPPSDPH